MNREIKISANEGISVQIAIAHYLQHLVKELGSEELIKGIETPTSSVQELVAVYNRIDNEACGRHIDYKLNAIPRCLGSDFLLENRRNLPEM